MQLHRCSDSTFSKEFLIRCKFLSEVLVFLLKAQDDPPGGPTALSDVLIGPRAEVAHSLDSSRGSSSWFSARAMVSSGKTSFSRVSKGLPCRKLVVLISTHYKATTVARNRVTAALFLIPVAKGVALMGLELQLSSLPDQ